MLYRRHHGKNKLSDEEELGTVNLVLTTYHTVAAEWKANQSQSTRKSPLFSVRWKRIILDEGE
jgi:SNF2 family DNA or RNA helicase